MASAVERARDAGRRVAGSASDAGRDIARGVARVARRTRAVGNDTAKALAHNAGPELAGSVTRLRAVRRPSEAASAFEDEVGYLLRVVAPVLVEHPLPIHDAATGRVVAATVAAGAVTVEEAEEISLLFSGGLSAPGLAGVVALAFFSLYTEVHVAVSLRVHMLEAAGEPVDAERVTRDVAAALVGSKPFGGRFLITRGMVKKVAARLLRRWGAGLVPFIGIAYSAWDSQATIATIAAMPIDEGAPAPPALPSGPAPAPAY